MDGMERSFQINPLPQLHCGNGKKKTQEFLISESSFKMQWGNRRHYFWGLPVKRAVEVKAGPASHRTLGETGKASLGSVIQEARPVPGRSVS